MSSAFKVPSVISQDLLLIQDLVGDIVTPKTVDIPSSQIEDDSIASSGEDSEEEVEANLFPHGDDMDAETLPDSSGSESEDSSDDSESEEEVFKHGSRDIALSLEDANDDEDAPVQGPTAYTKTLNEVVEDYVVIPDISEIDPQEPMEKVGEISSILNNKVVVVKGLASKISVAERVLDSDTLLVFEDRKVMGFIYETFGPTYQPLYQVRFNDKFPLDLERAKLSYPVFYVPGRSKLLFVSQLKHYKGSDASNAHDEEPGEDEIEFSDDEQEAAYKRQKREGRSQSREAFSRQGTPSGSRRRDAILEDNSFGSNPYDAHGPYDMDYGAGPSRPPPIPYDDPYSDPYGDVPTGEPMMDGADVVETNSHRSPQSASESPVTPGARPMRGRGRGRGRLTPDRGTRRRGRGRGGGGPPSAGWNSGHSQQITSETHGHDTSPAAHSQSNGFPPFALQFPSTNWSQQNPLNPFPQQDFSFGYPNQTQFGSVQPHINPRFANQFGFNFSPPQNQHEPYYGGGTGPHNWQGDPAYDGSGNGGG